MAVAFLPGSLVAQSVGCVGSGEPRADQPLLSELAVVREALGMPECEAAEDWIPAGDAGMTEEAVAGFD